MNELMLKLLTFPVEFSVEVSSSAPFVPENFIF